MSSLDTTAVVERSQSPEHAGEIAARQRFAFGKNWQRLLRILTEERIHEAEESLRRMLQMDDLTGKSFLDVGSGSGLFSLAARRLGARVRSFDYDPDAVWCTRELRTRYCPEDLDWLVEEGSVLNEEYMSKLGTYDMVYSWGVLHHTGSLHRALTLVAHLVRHGGLLYVAIGNDQRELTTYWKEVKRRYNRSLWERMAIIALHVPYLIGVPWLFNTIMGRKKRDRGMAAWTDMLDWLGGYPFETARPEEIVECYVSKGFALRKMTTCGGRHGCNEYVFVRSS